MHCHRVVPSSSCLVAIEKITKIQFSARTSASMSTGTDPSHSPRRQPKMVTATYIKQHSIPQMQTAYKSAPDKGRNKVFAVKGNCTSAILQHFVLE
jgi:hypothetical protein